MALSKDEQQVLAEIERRLADDDPVLATRLTTFRLPRLTLAPRSPRARLLASLLMLVVVAVVSVFVYVLMPFRGQTAGQLTPRGTAAPSRPAMTAPSSKPSSPATLPRGFTGGSPGPPAITGK